MHFIIMLHLAHCSVCCLLWNAWDWFWYVRQVTTFLSFFFFFLAGYRLYKWPGTLRTLSKTQDSRSVAWTSHTSHTCHIGVYLTALPTLYSHVVFSSFFHHPNDNSTSSCSCNISLKYRQSHLWHFAKPYAMCILGKPVLCTSDKMQLRDFCSENMCLWHMSTAATENNKAL